MYAIVGLVWCYNLPIFTKVPDLGDIYFIHGYIVPRHALMSLPKRNFSEYKKTYRYINLKYEKAR